MTVDARERAIVSEEKNGTAAADRNTAARLSEGDNECMTRGALPEVRSGVRRII